MITLNKAIKTGKFIELYSYKTPIQYGYKIPPTYRQINNTTVKKDHQKQSSIRAKNKIRRLIIGNIYHYQQYKPSFLTLTFKENITLIKDANYQFTLFIKRINYFLGYKIRYVSVPEFQKRGAVHYHLIIFNTSFISAIKIEEIWANGDIEITLANRGYKAFNYITKYISKTFEDERYKNQKRYFYSLENKDETIFNSEEVVKIYNNLTQDNLLGEFEYMIKDDNGNITNEVRKREYYSL